jgi:hypothetical protein
VILAHSVTPGTVRLTVAPNGYAASPSDIAALATAAALLPQSTPRGVWIKGSELPDLEAMCETRGVVVQRTGRPR